MASSAQYRYESLQTPSHIRLLRLKVGDEPASIQISLFVADLQRPPKYEALSYTWGDPDKTTMLTCNESGDAISITLNCDAALRRLRSADKERNFWIDAICIDQRNSKEKSRQVQMMSEIFQKAQRVVAYLGEASDDSDVGIDFVLELEASMGKVSAPSAGLDSENASSPQQQAINNILMRPFFERIWILQEIVFATEVLIILGDRTANWVALSKAVNHIDVNEKIHLGNKYRKRPPNAVFYRDKSTGFFNPEDKRTGAPKSLLKFLKETRRYKATDPRDKLYALLNMTPEKEQPVLAPNYTLSTREVFTALAKFFINRDKNLDILCYVQGSPSVHNLPSWVPDWSHQHIPDVLGHAKTVKSPYKATLERPATVHLEYDPETLVCKGKAFDAIFETGPIYNMGSESSATSLQKWEELGNSSLGKMKNEEILQTFMDTLIAYPPYKIPNIFAQFYGSWKLVTFREPTASSSSSVHKSAEAAIFNEHLNLACNRRCFFLTVGDRMGIGPAETMIGDKLVVLMGAAVPFVIREKNKGWRLIGECYVKGVMGGEVVEDESIVTEEFRIV